MGSVTANRGKRRTARRSAWLSPCELVHILPERLGVSSVPFGVSADNNAWCDRGFRAGRIRCYFFDATSSMLRLRCYVFDPTSPDAPIIASPTLVSMIQVPRPWKDGRSEQTPAPHPIGPASNGVLHRSPITRLAIARAGNEGNCSDSAHRIPATSACKRQKCSPGSHKSRPFFKVRDLAARQAIQHQLHSANRFKLPRLRISLDPQSFPSICIFRQAIGSYTQRPPR